MKRVVAAAFFVLLPTQGMAKEHLKKFRWTAGADGQPKLFLGAAMSLDRQADLLPGVDEKIRSGKQMVGPAEVQGTWRQAIYKPDGSVAYTAGEVIEGLPSAKSLQLMEDELNEGLRMGLSEAKQLKGASRVFPATLQIQKNEKGEWVPCWRVEYLTQSGDRLKFVQFGRDGRVLDDGELEWDGVDGRALVFPNGPKFGAAEERPLRDLTGEGTITGRLLRVFSALDLKVWSPQFTFFFSLDDRRFDLGQAYFTIEQGFRWMKDHLGVELNQPIDVRLHVGEGGVSNAAFYHQDTIYLGAGDGVTYRDLIRDPSVLIHEGIHAIVDSYVGLPSEGEGGSFNEGFADLFTALILDNPRMGESSYLRGPFRRTLEHDLMAYRDFKPGVYQNGSIVAATFWDMKPSFGAELTAKLAFRTLVRLGRGARFDDLPSAMASAAEGLLSQEQMRFAMETARRRGWRVP